MNQKKPQATLTWKKDDKYAHIDRYLHKTTCIDKETGKEVYSMTQVDQIPPITRKRKPK